MKLCSRLRKRGADYETKEIWLALGKYWRTVNLAIWDLREDGTLGREADYQKTIFKREFIDGWQIWHGGRVFQSIL